MNPWIVAYLVLLIALALMLRALRTSARDLRAANDQIDQLTERVHRNTSASFEWQKQAAIAEEEARRLQEQLNDLTEGEEYVRQSLGIPKEGA